MSLAIKPGYTWPPVPVNLSAHKRSSGNLAAWRISAVALGAGIIANAILAGRILVQLTYAQGGLAEAVYEAGGFLQSPFSDEAAIAPSHGIFETETVGAMVIYSVLAAMVPLAMVLLLGGFGWLGAAAGQSLAATAMLAVGLSILLRRGVTALGREAVLGAGAAFRQAGQSWAESAPLRADLAMRAKLGAKRLALWWSQSVAGLRRGLVLASELTGRTGGRLAAWWSMQAPLMGNRLQAACRQLARWLLETGTALGQLLGQLIARVAHQALQTARRLLAEQAPILRRRAQTARYQLAILARAWWEHTSSFMQLTGQALRRLTESFAAKR